MQIYHYNDEGIYIGSTEATESPLEPGVFLIPAKATAVEVPEYGEDFHARWDGELWDIELIPPPVVEPDPQPAEDIDVPEPEPEYVPTIEDHWAYLRRDRDYELAETDYLALTDQTLTEEMRVYRQALRDLPANTIDPANPVWPPKPNN